MFLNTYFDFAENDFQFFKSAYDHGLYANSMGATAQSICERYLKHIIDQYMEPQNETETQEREAVLRSHNLLRLLNYIEANSDISFSEGTKTELRSINGYYFTTRYPGDDSVQLTNKDLYDCVQAVNDCREEVIEIINELE